MVKPALLVAVTDAASLADLRISLRPAGRRAGAGHAALHRAHRLIILFITLSITPLRRFTGRNSLVKVRRLIGLFSFFYARLHLPDLHSLR